MSANSSEVKSTQAGEAATQALRSTREEIRYVSAEITNGDFFKNKQPNVDSLKNQEQELVAAQANLQTKKNPSEYEKNLLVQLGDLLKELTEFLSTLTGSKGMAWQESDASYKQRVQAFVAARHPAQPAPPAQGSQVNVQSAPITEVILSANPQLSRQAQEAEDRELALKLQAEFDQRIRNDEAQQRQSKEYIQELLAKEQPTANNSARPLQSDGTPTPSLSANAPDSPSVNLQPENALLREQNQFIKSKLHAVKEQLDSYVQEANNILANPDNLQKSESLENLQQKIFTAIEKSKEWLPLVDFTEQAHFQQRANTYVSGLETLSNTLSANIKHLDSKAASVQPDSQQLPKPDEQSNSNQVILQRLSPSPTPVPQGIQPNQFLKGQYESIEEELLKQRKLLNSYVQEANDIWATDPKLFTKQEKADFLHNLRLEVEKGIKFAELVHFTEAPALQRRAQSLIRDMEDFQEHLTKNISILADKITSKPSPAGNSLGNSAQPSLDVTLEHKGLAPR